MKNLDVLNDKAAISEYYPEFAKSLPDWHPVKTYLLENYYLQSILKEIESVDAMKDFQLFFNLFNNLCEVEKRYTRKENQLFPYLEKRGWNGPSQGMWSFHDSNRDLLRAMRKKIEDKDMVHINKDMKLVVGELRRMIAVEESRLLPISLELLTDEDWQEMSVGEEEIGWMLPERPPAYNQPKKKSKASEAIQEGRLRMNEGYMTLEQINLLLKFAPVDLTYVDENDRVIFYNRGEERVFPRSAAVIGREVRFCHPPKSLDTVLRIVNEFRNGTKDEAEFWIRYRGKVVHIRYFAIRDEAKNYRGVIEVSQDITKIQKLEGERRLLNWDEEEISQS